MLSAATLERVSVAYRRGYMDGYNQRPNTGALVKPEYIKPFADFDYDEGYRAGTNDRKWADKRISEQRGFSSLPFSAFLAAICCGFLLSCALGMLR